MSFGIRFRKFANALARQFGLRAQEDWKPLIACYVPIETLDLDEPIDGRQRIKDRQCQESRAAGKILPPRKVLGHESQLFTVRKAGDAME